MSDTGGFDDWRRPRGARPDDSADDTTEGAVNDATGAQAPEPAAPPVAPPPSFTAQPPLSAAPPPVFRPAAPPPPVTPSLSTAPPPPVTPSLSTAPPPPVTPSLSTAPPPPVAPSLSTAPPPTFPPAGPTPAFPPALPAGPALNTAPPPADPPRSQAAPPPVVPAAPDQAPPPLVAPPAPPAPAAPPIGSPLSTTPPPAVLPPAAPPTASPTPSPTPSWEQPTQAYSIKDLRAPESTPAAPAPSWEEPTQAYDFRQASLDPALAGPTEVLGAQEIGLPTLRDEGLRPPTGENSAIDSLFGENQFQEYEAGALPAEGFGALASTRPRVEREPLSKVQRTLLLVAGGLVAALVLIGVFALGVANPGILPAAEPEPVATTAPAPVAAAPAVGPLAPGTYAWDELLGTECLDPWTSPWAEEFTVVDCAAPHPAQLVSRGIFGDEAYAAYPGVEALQARMNLLCTAPTSIDYGVASALNDVQVSSAYPVTEEQWDAGQRSYFCYVTRSGSETLTVSLAPVPVVDAAPVPSIPGNAP